MVYSCNILDKGAKFLKIELCCIIDDVKYPCRSKEFLKMIVALSIFPFLWKRANTEIASFRNSLRWQIYIINPVDLKPNYFLTSQTCTNIISFQVICTKQLHCTGMLLTMHLTLNRWLVTDFSLTTKIIVKRHFLVKWINYFFNSFQKWVDVINFSFFLQ